MSGITLTTPVDRGTDSGVDILFVGVNYDSSSVIVRLRYQQTGQTRDFMFSGPSLTSLRNAVNNFAGLRVALLQYLQTLDSTLTGNVT